MRYQVLARKLRPQKFQEVVGQQHVIRSLQNAILKGRLGHAYLFAGTRGVGKTTVARIFAKALRCESPEQDGNSCGKCKKAIEHQETAFIRQRYNKVTDMLCKDCNNMRKTLAFMFSPHFN